MRAPLRLSLKTLRTAAPVTEDPMHVTEVLDGEARGRGSRRARASAAPLSTPSVSRSYTPPVLALTALHPPPSCCSLSNVQLVAVPADADSTTTPLVVNCAAGAGQPCTV